MVGGVDHYVYMDASRYNKIYNDNIKTVQPPSVTMRFYIKYK